MKTDQKPPGVPSVLQPQAKPRGSSRCSRCVTRPSPRNWYKTSTFLVQKGGRACANSEGLGVATVPFVVLMGVHSSWLRRLRTNPEKTGIFRNSDFRKSSKSANSPIFHPTRPRCTKHLRQIKIGARRFSVIRAFSFFRHSSFAIRHSPPPIPSLPHPLTPS